MTCVSFKMNCCLSDHCVRLEPSSLLFSLFLFNFLLQNPTQSTRFKISDIGIVSDERFSYQISDSREYIGDSAYRAFISDILYNEILITKCWFSVIDIIYQIKMM